MHNPIRQDGTVKSLLTTREAAEYAGVVYQHLANLRSQGQGPRYLKLGGVVRYRPADVRNWRAVSPGKGKVTPKRRDVLLTSAQAATYFRLSNGYLARMRCEQRGPVWLKPAGKGIRYDWVDIQLWLDGCEHG